MRKLLATNSSWRGNARLYLEDDHLVHTNLVFVTERIRRFYFQDIQAIVCHRSPAGMYLNILCLLAALILSSWGYLLFARLGGDPEFDTITIIAVLLLSVPAWLVLLYNISQGKTCETWIYTPVSRVRLHGLGRLAKTNKTLDYLRPIIARAQQEYVAAETPEQRSRASLAPYYKEDPQARPGCYGPIGSVKPFVLFYALMLLYTAIYSINVFYFSATKLMFDELVFLALFGVASYILYNFRGQVHLPALRLYTLIMVVTLMILKQAINFWFQLGAFSFGMSPHFGNLEMYTPSMEFYLHITLLPVMAIVGIAFCFGHKNWAAAQQAASPPTGVGEASIPAQESVQESGPAPDEAHNDAQEPSHD